MKKFVLTFTLVLAFGAPSFASAHLASRGVKAGAKVSVKAARGGVKAVVKAIKFAI